MGVGIDWVSAAIFLGAFVLAQIRSVSPRVRYGGLAVACGAIGLLRLRQAGVGLNRVFVVIALGLAVYYAIRAMRARA